MSQQTLSKSAQIVQNALAQKGLSLNVIELSATTRTAQDAAAAVGCSVSQIVKSLVFRVDATQQPLLLLVSGSNRVNEKVIEQHLGNQISRPDADYVCEVTGFAIGGIPPVGHKQTIQTLIDQDLLKYDFVWAAAGTPNAIFSLKSSDLQNLTNGMIISVN